MLLSTNNDVTGDYDDAVKMMMLPADIMTMMTRSQLKMMQWILSIWSNKPAMFVTLA